VVPPVVLGPDLVVTWNQLTVTGPDRKGFYKVNGSIMIKNQGNLPSNTCLMNVYYPDESHMILKKPIKVKKLKPGLSASRKFVVRGLSMDAGNKNLFTASVDAENIVLEINEENNEATFTITIP
jgi:hypothetical protein